MVGVSRPDETTVDAWRALLRAHVHLTAALDAELRRDQDLPLEWYDVLLQLHDHDGRLRMSELADVLLVSRSNCTRLVDRLERARLVTREVDPDDARGRLAALTVEGRRRLRRAAPTHLDGIARHVGGPLAAAGADTAALRDALRALAAG